VADIEVIGIDIPIGLPEEGPRECDIEARKLLGRTRGSSVFPAPIKEVLYTEDYGQACDIRYRIEGKKMSKQAWAIVPKIREVDLLLKERPQLNTLFYEVHPEVSFYFMGRNEPNTYSKKKKLGIEERIEKPSPHFNINYDYVKAKSHELRGSEDDIVDALAALWSAERVFHGINRILPVASNVEGPRIYA
jgi:predicted RNase H-like nuclease